jgi:hypothetical protein
MQLIRWPFRWPCGSGGKVPSASSSTAGLGLPLMPLDAAIGQVFTPYRPSGRHGHQFCRVAYRVGIFRSISVGISRYLPYRYRRKTWSVFSVSKLWRELLNKLVGAPFFLRRGGLGPLLVHFALLLKKKRNSRGIFQKKSSREILKRCSRQSLQYNNTDRKIPIPAVSDTG